MDSFKLKTNDTLHEWCLQAAQHAIRSMRSYSNRSTFRGNPAAGSWRGCGPLPALGKLSMAPTVIQHIRFITSTILTVVMFLLDRSLLC